MERKVCLLATPFFSSPAVDGRGQRCEPPTPQPPRMLCEARDHTLEQHGGQLHLATDLSTHTIYQPETLCCWPVQSNYVQVKLPSVKLMLISFLVVT